MRRFLKAISLALFGLVTVSIQPLSPRAEIQPWTNLGLNGGEMYDIAVHPSNPDKLFAGSYYGDGLFVSEDGGMNWRAVITGQENGELDREATFRNTAVWAVKLAKTDPKVLWVAHNHWVEKSLDGGQTWQHIRIDDMQRDCVNCGGEEDSFRFCRSLAVDPSNPQHVYVGTGGPWETDANGAVYSTEDGGVTWKKTNQGLNFDYSVVDLAIDPNNPDVIWAVTSSFGSDPQYGEWGTLYRSEDRGENWETIFYINGLFYDVEIKPNDSNSIFTANTWGIFRHFQQCEQDNEGNETCAWRYQWILNYTTFPAWPPPQDEEWARRVRALAFDPQNPDVLYASWSHPWSSDPRPKVARGTPPYDVPNWEIYPSPYLFLTLAVHPTNSDVIFGGELNRGVYKSQDHGQTWTPLNKGINAVIVRDVDIDPNDSRHILAATSIGVCEKRDASQWALISDFPYSTAYSVKFHPSDSQTIYAGIESQVAGTEDGGASWFYSNWLDAYDPYAHNYVNDIAVYPKSVDPKTASIFVSVNGWGNYGEIYRRTFNGDSFNFEKVLDGLNQMGEEYPFNAIAIDPSNNRIFAGGGSFYAPKILGDLWESQDGGTNWNRTALSNVVVNALLVDPENPDVMYAGCGYSDGTDVPVYKSMDGGSTWAASAAGIPERAIPLNGIWGRSAKDVYVVGDNGVTLHYDGQTWSAPSAVTAAHLLGVWGSPDGNLYAVGDKGTILHYDGSGWSAVPSGTTEQLNGVWGSSSVDVYAVGDKGTILHYDGSGWSLMTSGTTEQLNGVWGSSSADVYAVGDKGTILHYDGASWSPVPSGTTKQINGVWGSSSVDVYAVGDNGTILHYDGGWTSVTSGTTEPLNGVWGSSGTDVFVAGDYGTMLHCDGVSCTRMDSGETEGLAHVWGTSGTSVFVAGQLGGISHYDGRGWSSIRPAGALWNAVTDLAFHREDPNIVYASTSAAGVYVSPDGAGNWVNLGTPPYDVYAISTSSLYAGTQGGLLQCTGTGVISGQVMEAHSQAGINNASIVHDLGIRATSVNGSYLMVSPAGIFGLNASAPGYYTRGLSGVTVYGGDVTWVDIPMEALPPPAPSVSDNATITSDATNTKAVNNLTVTEGVHLNNVTGSINGVHNSGVITGGILDGDINNMGTLKNVTIATGGIVQGGTLDGTITNSGTISGLVTLTEGSAIVGGTISGTLTGLGKGAVVKGALIDAASVSNVAIGEGCKLTQGATDRNPGLDLLGAITENGSVNPRALLLVDDEGKELSVNDLIGQEVKGLLSDASAATVVDGTGKVTISAGSLGRVFLPTRVYSVLTTSDPDGLKIAPTGELVLTRNRIAITLAPASADEASFGSALEGLGAAADLLPNGVVVVELPDGSRLALRFDSVAVSSGGSGQLLDVATSSGPASLGIKGDPANRETFFLLVTYPDGTQQKMPPSVHDLGALEDFLGRYGISFSLVTSTGVIRIPGPQGEVLWRGIPEYFVVPVLPGAAGISMEPAGDLNGDGLPDLYVITERGKQAIYALP
jgi:hypothetical protein